ncbi:MAG: hypothetical protein IPJ65_42200 [Archangiaceae bacterium]|nr:hypothetical protein [Archangiaceae bacterium]
MLRVGLLALWFLGCREAAPPAPPAPVEEPEAEPWGDADANAALRVLFIGNSYTQFNDLPHMLERIAETSRASPRISTAAVLEGGAQLVTHWNQGRAQRRIAERRWTHVVVQGQSLEPIDDPTRFEDYALRFVDLSVAAHARPVLFVTWARGPGSPPRRVTGWHPLMQDRISDAYRNVARQRPQSLLVCIGEAFRAAVEEHPELRLHDADLSHPTVHGSYLAASTMYVALTGREVPPESEVPEGVSAGTAELLRGLARVGSSCADVSLTGQGARPYGSGSLLDPGERRGAAGGGSLTGKPYCSVLLHGRCK